MRRWRDAARGEMAAGGKRVFWPSDEKRQNNVKSPFLAPIRDVNIAQNLDSVASSTLNGRLGIYLLRCNGKIW